MPILLRELLYELDHEKKDGMIHVEEWRVPEVEYLHNMGFDFLDDYKMGIGSAPNISVYKKEEMESGKNKPEIYFVVEEDGRSTKRFKDFKDVINNFDTYNQPEIDKRK